MCAWNASFDLIRIACNNIFFSLFFPIEFIKQSSHTNNITSTILFNISSWTAKTSVLTSWRRKSTLSIDRQKLFVLSDRQVGMRKGMSRRNGRYRYRYFVFYVLVGLIYPPHTYILSLCLSLISKQKPKGSLYLWTPVCLFMNYYFFFFPKFFHTHDIPYTHTWCPFAMLLLFVKNLTMVPPPLTVR